jgi:hypothetical protein
MICLEFVNILRRHKIKNILKKSTGMRGWVQSYCYVLDISSNCEMNNLKLRLDGVAPMVLLHQALFPFATKVNS